MVQFKFKVTEKTETMGTDGQGNRAFKITFTPVQTEDFGKYTPCATFNATIVNDKASEQLIVGKEYLMDVYPAEKV